VAGRSEAGEEKRRRQRRVSRAQAMLPQQALQCKTGMQATAQTHIKAVSGLCPCLGACSGMYGMCMCVCNMSAPQMSFFLCRGWQSGSRHKVVNGQRPQAGTAGNSGQHKVG